MQLSEDVPRGRHAAMTVLAQSDAAGIERGLAAANCEAQFVDLRSPEIGLVMLRGRIGGNGAPFNVGEATVTRAAVQLASGEQGFAYILGRDTKKARLAALCDALWQTEVARDRIEQHVLAPLRAALDRRRQHERARTAATKVDFFTLVRGEDEP
jgi:alpha-D-ribose 1-methylphosphonate 5-triphosphate synthase subunit PhnG